MNEMPRFIRARDLAKITGLSVQTIYRRINAGRFPKQVSLGGSVVGWRSADVQEWMQAPADWPDAPETAPK